MAFGRPVQSIYRLDQADVVVALDADILTCGTGHLRYVHDFMNRRRLRGDRPTMNRLYAVESMPSGTGAVADHRLPMRAGVGAAPATAVPR